MRSTPFTICVGFLAIALVMAATYANGPDAAPPVEVPEGNRHPELIRLSPREEVWIDRDRKEVVVGGKIALDEGAIEVFACPAGTKDHEAIVATKSSAKLVHAGLLAIGLEPGRPSEMHPTFRPAEGPTVDIRLRWRDAEGTMHERLAREVVRNVLTGEPLAADWVFVGSHFFRNPETGEDVYLADGGDFICVSNFPGATLELPLESTQENGELMFEVFEGRVPAPGTPVELVLSKRGVADAR